MTQKTHEPHRRHLAAFLATGAFILLGTNATTSRHYAAYLTPEESGFLPAVHHAAEQLPEERSVVCRDSHTDEIVQVISYADFLPEEEESVGIEADVISKAKGHMNVLNDLQAAIEEDDAFLMHAAATQAPAKPAAQEVMHTSTLKRVTNEVMRWFQI